MNDIAAEAYRQFLVAWVDRVRKWALLVVLASVAFSVVVAYYVVGNVSINTSTTDMLSPELQFRKDSKEFSKAFPQFGNNITVVVQGETPDLADDAALKLAARLRQHPEFFGFVRDLAGEPFFRKNGLLFLDEDELSDLSDRLAEAQPFLGVLWNDPSLRGLLKMMELVIDEILKKDGDAPIKIGPVLKAMAEVAEKQAQGRFSSLSWQELMADKVSEKKDKRRYISFQPVMNFKTLQPASKAINAVRKQIRELQLDESKGVRVSLTGSAALSQEELKSVQEGMGLAAALSLVLVFGLLTTGFRTPRLVVSVLATLIMGLIWTAGFAVFFLESLNLISVAFAVLFIGLSVDFGIHFGLRYKEEIDKGAEHGAALEAATAGVGGALTLCAVAAAIAFYSFLPTDYLGLAELGLIAGSGMFIALFANVTVLPAILTLAPLKKAPKRKKRGISVIASRYSLEHAKAIAFGGLVLFLASLAFLGEAKFDFDPLNLKDPKTESVAVLLEMMDDSRTSPYFIKVLTADLKEAVALAEKLKALDVVDSTETLADYVPKGQDEKLDIIGTMALFLAPSLSSTEQKPAPAAQERAQSLASFREKLKLLSSTANGPGAQRVEAAFSKLLKGTPNDADVLVELEKRMISSLPGRLKALNESLLAEPVTLESLPERLKAGKVAADGRARVTIYPKKDLKDREALREFIRDVRRVAPRATGSPVIILEAGEAVVESFRVAALLALGSISLLLALLLRALRDVLLVFAPLTLAAMLTVAFSVIFNLPFNFANVIVLPLLFGLGVASAIHLVIRERKEHDPAAALVTSTPRAVFFSALTTIGSFGSIALSSHPGTSSMGALLTVAITLSLVCTLGVLPALMALWPSNPAPIRPNSAVGSGESE